MLALVAGFMPVGLQPAQADDNETKTVSTWDGKIDTDWYTENEDTFSLTTAAQLAGLAKLVNDGNNFSGKTINLDADLNLGGSSIQWTPIGTSNTYPFTGTFNGDNHTISGLYINASTASNQGLFGYVGSGGSVQNLTVSGEVTAKDYVGGVVGYNRGTVNNCTVSSSSSGTQRVGGVVGGNISSGTVTNCTNTGTVTVTGTTVSYAGGVAGHNGGSVSNCTNTGAVTGTATGGYGSSYAGGVVGSNLDSGTVTNCANRGNITGTATVETGSSYAGGVVGNNSFSTVVNNCYNTGEVTATGEYGSLYAGGVVGYNSSGSVTNCYYLDTSCNNPGGGISKTDAQFHSGEVAWLLQNGQDADDDGVKPQVWGQSLSDENKDDHPVLTNDSNKAVLISSP